MATEKITIIVEEKGSVVVKRNIKELGNDITVVDKRVNALKKSTIDLRSVFAGFAAVLGVGALINYSDAATRLSNTLKIAGLQGAEFSDVQERIYQSAIQNGQVATDLGAVYQKLKISQKDLNASGEDVISVTEGVAAAMRLSTAGTGAQQGALQQLSQSFGGVKVQAQEFNSLIDGAYPLLQAAANGSDKWKGSVAALSRDVKASNVLTKDFFDALKIGLKDTEALAASMPLTIGQAFTSLETAFTRFLANSNGAASAAGALSGAIGFVANNFEAFANILIPIIALIGVNFAVTAVGAAITGLFSLVTAITAGTGAVVAFTVAWAPLIATAAAVVVGITAVGYAVYQIIDYFLAGTTAWEAWKTSAVNSVEEVKKSFSGILSFFGGAGTPAKIEITADKASTQMVEAGYSIEQRIRSGADYSALALKGSFDEGGDTVSLSVTQAGALAGTSLRGSMEMGGQTVAETWKTVFGDFIGGLVDWAASFFSTASNAATGPATGLDKRKTDEAAKKLGDGVRSGSDSGGTSMGLAVSGAGATAGTTMSNSVSSAGTTAGNTIGNSVSNAGNSAGSAMGTGVANGGSSAAGAIRSAMVSGAQQAASIIASAIASAVSSAGGGGGGGGNTVGYYGSPNDAYNQALAAVSADTWTKDYRPLPYIQLARGGEFRVGGNGGTDSQRVEFMASPDEVVSVRTPGQQATERNTSTSQDGGSRPVTIQNIMDPQAAADSINSRYGQEIIFNTIRTDPDKFRRALGLPS